MAYKVREWLIDHILDLGFELVSDDGFGIFFERYNDQFKYMHRVDILHKANGGYLIQSYNKDHITDISADCVGLTPREALAFGQLALLLEETEGTT